MADFTDKYKKITITVSRKKYEKFKEMADHLKLPLSRFITYGLSNIFDNFENFKVDTDWSDAPECIVGEDKVLFDFISSSPKGAGVDYMIIYNDVIGLSVTQVKSAIKKLVNEKKIKRTKMKTKFFDYPEDYEAYKSTSGYDKTESEKTPEEMEAMFKSYYGVEKFNKMKASGEL